MSDSDVLSHFAPLDELIQVIYQSSARFIIISSVDDVSWSTHVGLTGDEGRWWRGRWTDKDVRSTVGSKVSSILLESFVEKMADTFVKGDITIGGWSSAKDAQIELVIGTTAKTPIRVSLSELAPADAAAFATKVFAEIALQAQSRRCRLYPSSYDTSSTPSVLAPVAGTSLSGKAASRRTPSPSPERVTKTKHNSSHRVKDKGKDREKTKEKSSSSADAKSDNARKRNAEEAEATIAALRAELEKEKRKQGAIMTDPSKLLPKNKVAAVSRPKGASLANPTKKARKYQAIEFESDEE